MSAPHCLVVGAGRMTGGFVAPLLRAAGWDVTIACRNPDVRMVIQACGGFHLFVAGEPERWVAGVAALALDDPGLLRAAARADLIATAVGPTSLAATGEFLAPLVRARLDASPAPLNVITFENHRRAPELLMSAMVEQDATLAAEIGRRLGIGGAAVWRIISERRIAADGVRFSANDEDECYVDALALVSGAPPHDGSLPGIALVRAFDNRMVEKLWLFNAGHCAAAYLGWHAGYETVADAMADPAIRAAVGRVVDETRQALAAHVANRPGSEEIPERPIASILDRYVEPALADPVARVAREPRRKLAPDDRLIGPGVTCLAAGLAPDALAQATAAALAYAEPSDPQSGDLQRELDLVGPAEVLATVCGLYPPDEFAAMVCAAYDHHMPVGAVR
jgi:mannitol-1-phosphate 5-dehydrogenase